MATARQLRLVNQAAQKFEFDEGEEASQGIHPALDVVGGKLYVTVRASVGKKLQQFTLTSDGHGNINVSAASDPQDLTCELGVPLLRTADISDLPPRWNSASLHKFQNSELTAPEWKEAYDAIYKAFDEHLVVVDSRYLVVLTLHAMMTYFHPMFDVLPILHLYGPSESGKSRAAIALGNVAFNARVAGSATQSTVFRNADKGRYTQILTEMDNLTKLDSGDPFVQQLQGSTTKAEASVAVSDKSAKEGFKPTTFYGFSPRVLASTREFKALTLRNRCIRLNLVKSVNADKAKLNRSMNDNAKWSPLRDMLYRLQLLRWREVEDARETLQSEWNDDNAPTGRVRDKWLPLATMARLVGVDALEVVTELAGADMEEQKEDTAGSIMGILCNFMEYVVRDGDVTLRRHELWEKLLYCGQYPNQQTASDEAQPDWAKACGDSITRGKLKEMFSSDVMLAKALKNNMLIPDIKKLKTHSEYRINQTDVQAITRAYISAPDEGLKEARTRPDKQPTPFHAPDDDDPDWPPF